MEPLSFSSGQTLTIHNQENAVANKMFQMNSPFLLTYEYCSGTDADDYINFLTLSELDQTLSQERYSRHQLLFEKAPAHFHDYFELLIVLEGSVTQKIEDREYKYNAGSCCIITRSLCHCETFDSAARLLFIGLSVDFMTKLFEEARHSSILEESAILGGPVYDFIMNDIKTPGQKAYLDFIPTLKNMTSYQLLHQYSENIVTALLHPHFGSHYISVGAICSILSFLSSPDCYHCTLTSLDKSSDFLIFARVEHILQENNGRISRNELAKALNYSGDYLNRIVNKYTGMCLSDYGMKFSLQKAVALLKTTDSSISSIAADLGFTNRTFFYKIFQEEFGMTPKEYRAAYKEGI